MIDTLKLGFDNCEVKDGADIFIQQPPCKLNEEAPEGTPLFKTSKGWQLGNKAYINTDCFNLTFKPVAGKPYAFVQFSIPKVVFGLNTGEVNRRELETALELVESELHDLGVCVSLKDVYLSRIDLFKDAETERPFSEYSPLFDLLELSRMQKKDYGTTYLFSNTVQELCIYDKNEEIRLKAKKAGAEIPELTGNLIRCENRLLSKAKIGKALQIDTAKGLLDNFDYLREFYNTNVEKFIFIRDIAALPLPLQVEPDYTKRNVLQDYNDKLLNAYLAQAGNTHKKAYLNRVKSFASQPTYSRTAKEIVTTTTASGEVESRYLELKAKWIGES